jgi:hypothetical protein
MLVVLIRGELLRRYPTTTVYAVRAATRSEPGTTELYPEFRGSLEPDLAFFGFGLSVAEAGGSETEPGWFFVIQQQATEPRFGLDEAKASHHGVAPAHWRELSWAHLVENPQDFAGLTHTPVATATLSEALRDLSLDGATWGQDAAHMGRIVLQDPVRVAIHGAAMLPAVNPAPTPITAVRRAGDRVSEVGGVDAFGEPWRMTEEAAVSGVRAGALRFFVEGPPPAEVVVAHRRGREYLKTVSDGELPNNLLALPELPA